MPKTFARLEELDLTAVTPTGWLRRFLEKQRDGLTGTPEASGYPFDTPGWGAPTINPKQIGNVRPDGWWPYEQTGYWLDGAIRCGHLLRDKGLLRKAIQQIDFTLKNQSPDGFLGPRILREKKPLNRWPHAVFFRAWMAHHSATRDARLPEALRRHYLSGTSPHSHHREACNVEAILWAYRQTGDRRLLEHALDAYEGFNRESPSHDNSVRSMLSDRRATTHGVTYNELGKLGAALYLHTGNRRHLAATINAYRKIDRDSMLVDGVPSSTEQLRGKDPLDSHETCDIADYTWSVGYLLQATGEPEYADKIERACFNAAPGAIKKDFTALQYFSCPNQVLADATSNHNLYHRGNDWMAYSPSPQVQCCAGEIHRIVPNYVARMWMRDSCGGIVAALYGPSKVSFDVDGKRVTIVEDTDYPFSDRINFRIEASAPATFTFQVRIPSWCKRAEILINGEPVPDGQSGSFLAIRNIWAPNDRITVILPMDLKLTRWPGGGVAIERGPLVYALRVEEDWRVDKTRKAHVPGYPFLTVRAASAWNYALAVDAKNLAEQVRIVQRAIGADPWANPPIELQVPARRVRGWQLEKTTAVTAEDWIDGKLKLNRRKGRFVFTPALPSPKALKSRLARATETVTLVPYGCTHLRIAVFPQAP